MNRIELSATIITFNEEKRISRCIASVHDWCDEVVVLDSYSRDGTRKKTTAFKKVRFYRHTFDGHIQQKNRAIKLAKGKWVFCLDADEVVTPDLANAIRKFIGENPDADGARVRRLTFHLGISMRHGGWYNTRYRLIRKGRGWWAGENPHDTIVIMNRKGWRAMQGPVLKGDIMHFSFKDIAEQLDTINRFSSIVSFTRIKRGEKFSLTGLITKPIIKFIELYFFKRGILDGIPGLIAAILTSYSTFIKIAKMYDLQKNKLERPSNLGSNYKA